MKNCKHSKDILKLAYNDCGEDRKQLLTEHLTDCKDCAMIYNFHKNLQNINTVEIPKVSESLKFRIFDEINKIKEQTFIDIAYSYFHKKFMPAACAVLIFFIVGALVNAYQFSDKHQNILPIAGESIELTDYQREIITNEITDDLIMHIAFGDR